MKITPVYNISLLNKIYELQECTIDELRKAYLTPEAPGIISSKRTEFSRELDILANMGCVSMDGEKVCFKNWPS